MVTLNTMEIGVAYILNNCVTKSCHGHRAASWCY